MSSYIDLQIDGETIRLDNMEKGFKPATLPIFFNANCKLSSEQRKAQPTMFMPEKVWAYIEDPRVTHDGAFGSDFEIWSKQRVQKHYVGGYGPIASDWVAVWKFPGDLKNCPHVCDKDGHPRYKTIYDVPLPVGEYPFMDDGWLQRYRPDIRRRGRQLKNALLINAVLHRAIQVRTVRNTARVCEKRDFSTRNSNCITCGGNLQCCSVSEQHTAPTFEACQSS